MAEQVFRSHWNPNVGLGPLPIAVVGYPVQASVSNAEHPEVHRLSTERYSAAQQALSQRSVEDANSLPSYSSSRRESVENTTVQLGASGGGGIDATRSQATMTRYRSTCSRCAQLLEFPADTSVGTLYALNCVPCGGQTLVQLQPAFPVPTTPSVVGMPVTGPVGTPPPALPQGYMYMPFQEQSIRISLNKSGSYTVNSGGGSPVPIAPAAAPPLTKMTDDPHWNGVISKGFYCLTGKETTDDRGHAETAAPMFLIQVLEDETLKGDASSPGFDPVVVTGNIHGLGKSQGTISIKLRTVVGTKTYEGKWKGTHVEGHYFSGASYKAASKADKGTLSLEVKKLKQVST